MQAAVERVFREEQGRVTALLYTHLRDFQLVEDVVQEAFIVALERWPTDGIPDNPAGWLAVVARRKALDRIRREKTLTQKTALLQATHRTDWLVDIDPFSDERLKMIFMCCHPALSKQAQLALTLRTLGGLSTEEIAKAFLVPLPTMYQRIVRAKRKIRDAGIPFHIPAQPVIIERTSVVLSVLYLIYNAGYTAPTGDSLIRQDLCTEAIRLTRILLDLLHTEQIKEALPEVTGLLALMLLHDSRAAARVDNAGRLVPLEEQDRTLWSAEKIAEGQHLTDQALRMKQAGPYQLQAAISALHAGAAHPDDTDWEQIAVIYSLLCQMVKSPVIELNRIVAIAMARGIHKGLAMLDNFEKEGELKDYYLLYATRADLLRRLGDSIAAAEMYNLAITHCENEVERTYLQQRLQDIKEKGQTP